MKIFKVLLVSVVLVPVVSWAAGTSGTLNVQIVNEKLPQHIYAYIANIPNGDTGNAIIIGNKLANLNSGMKDSIAVNFSPVSNSRGANAVALYIGEDRNHASIGNCFINLSQLYQQGSQNWYVTLDASKTSLICSKPSS